MDRSDLVVDRCLHGGSAAVEERRHGCCGTKTHPCRLGRWLPTRVVNFGPRLAPLLPGFDAYSLLPSPPPLFHLPLSVSEHSLARIPVPVARNSTFNRNKRTKTNKQTMPVIGSRAQSDVTTVKINVSDNESAPHDREEDSLALLSIRINSLSPTSCYILCRWSVAWTAKLRTA